MSRHQTVTKILNNVAVDCFAEPAGGLPKQGPFGILIRQEAEAAVALAFAKRSDVRADGSLPYGKRLLSDRCTARSAEATGYTGDAATLSFTGQVLNNLPVAPFSVKVSGGVSQVQYDKFGDGRLFIYNADPALETTAGSTINYTTGAITLVYTVAPANLQALAADYVSTTKVGVNSQQHHQLMFRRDPIGRGEELKIWAVGLAKDGKINVLVDNYASGEL